MFLPADEAFGEKRLNQQELASDQDILTTATHTSHPSVFTGANSVSGREEGRAADTTIFEMKDELSALRSRQRHLDAKRREALNKILDIKGSIRVFCRVRSWLPGDKERSTPLRAHAGSDKITVLSAAGRKEFCGDRVFPQGTAQEDVFDEVSPILRSALDGHNVCVLAYGQTGTGKTFTMEGTTEKPGIVPRAIKEMFSQASQRKHSSAFSFSMSMLEVYMGSLRDLLAPKMPSRTSTWFSGISTKSNLSIQTGTNGSVEVEGLTDVPIDDFKEAYRWYARGKRARSTSWTNVNEASSRSHCLTRITIAQSVGGKEGRKMVSKFWMVDLGGSERLLKTGATGQTMDEGKAINLSLSSLGDVIAALKRKNKHVPFRNSKLTQILMDSLGENAKVLMIVHLSPSEHDVGETVCSLNFAKRARAADISREVPEDFKRYNEKRIAELQQQIREAESELENVTNRILTAESMISERRKTIENQKGSPRSPLIIDCETSESPRSAEKTASKSHASSLPRFMAPTVCSRQRQHLASETSSRVKAGRSEQRGSVALLGSQSRSFLDHHQSKPNQSFLKYQSNKIKELSILSANLSMRSLDVNSCSTPREPKVASSQQPCLRPVLGQHRRRMSSFV